MFQCTHQYLLGCFIFVADDGPDDGSPFVSNQIPPQMAMAQLLLI